MDKVHIRFEGRTLECRADTSVAVALWETGVRHLSRSPKYGRPRGLTCARGHCTACLMRVDRIPNVRTCELPVRDGMEIEQQDPGAFYAAPMQMVLAAGDALFPVGFYYKWFTRPPFLSRFFLERIRPMTGIGRLPEGTAPIRLLAAAPSAAQETSLHQANLGRFDTIVVGGGPAGLQAAATATGRVLVVDDHDRPGGQRADALRFLRDHHSGMLERFPQLQSALDRSLQAQKLFAPRQDIHFSAATKAIAGYHPGGLLLRRGGALFTADCDQLVWAAGALDTLGLFEGNDTPGALGPRALYRLLMRDGLDVQGKPVLVIGGGLDFWLSAAVLAAKGARLGLVLSAETGPDAVPAALEMNWQLNTGLTLNRIEPQGGNQLRATFSPRSSEQNLTGSHLEMEAEIAVICNRGKPAYDIPFQLGAEISLQPERGGFLAADPGGAQPDDTWLTTVGEAAGDLPGTRFQSLGEVESP